MIKQKSSKSRKLFHGITPALYTAYKKNGEVNYTETARLAEWLVDKGVKGFYLCGSTGEGLLMTSDERRRIVETVSVAVGRQASLMVHVGTMATRDAVELAKHAADQKGVVAISSLAPQYYGYTMEDEVAHLSTIATATNKPFYPYLFASGVAKYGTTGLIKAFSQIPQMGGIKAFVQDFSVHQALLMEGPPQWEILHGADECLAPALSIPGIDGAIGSSYNVVPEIVIAIYEATRRGDLKKAAALHRHYMGYWRGIYMTKALCMGRYFLSVRGFAMGEPRAPLRAPTAEMIKAAEQAHRALGFNIQRGGH
ncbi:MAG: dihydrodipicolinate synthase family protein [Kiritimatiellia bacterium]